MLYWYGISIGLTKVKLSHNMPSRNRGDGKVLLYPFWTPVLEWGGWSGSCYFAPRKDIQYPLHRRKGGPQCWSGLWKISPHWGSNPDHPAHRKSLHLTMLSHL